MADLDTPYSLLRAYDDGMQGYVPDERAKHEFLETQKYQYFREPNIRGSGIGKRALLWQYAQKLDKNCFTEAQTTGDCFVPGTLVRMGDGTEKPIELVETGDVVASPFGGVRRVLSSFSKEYDGVVCSLRGERCADCVTATADHRFVSHANKYEWSWVEAGALGEGDRVLVPFGDVSTGAMATYDLANEELCGENLNEFARGLAQKPRRISAPDGWVRALNSKKACRRYITLNEDVAWLIGVWLAEGSTDRNKGGLPHGLTWNLCSDELAIAKRIRHVLLRQFGVEASIRTLPSKPSCLFVTVGCAPIARWMYRICGQANTYSKRVPREVLSSPASVRMWCLRGWIEGDGHVSSSPRVERPQYMTCKVSGTSVSRQLVRDMKYLATSCRVLCGDRIRKAYKRSRQSSELFFYGEGAVAVMPGRLGLCKKKGDRESSTWRVESGFAQRVKENIRSHYQGVVYCIEVEGDHAFIANGYAVHNCVSHGSRNARDITRAVEILVKREPEDWFKMGATEPTYGARGHGGQGMSPARASRFERDTGFLARHDYGIVNLSKYNSSIGARWGSSGVPPEVQELCRQNKVGVITLVRTQDELLDALVNGYAAHSGQNASWSADSNAKGIHYRTAKGWMHDMAIVGVDDSKEFFPFRVWMIQNSWGPWNQKPKAWPKEYGEWVPGMILTSAEDFDVCVSSNDCWLYGSIDGYPPQRLPDYGTVGLLKHGD